jgi:hypothetical protein
MSPGAMPIGFPDSKIHLQYATARLAAQDARAESQAFDERSSVLLPHAQCLPAADDRSERRRKSASAKRSIKHAYNLYV